MRVSDIDDFKIYDLSGGRSLPEWAAERDRKRKRKDARREGTELIQDFSMPGLSTAVKMTADGRYALAVGVYKPRVKCFELDDLSLKFERCLDAEAVAFDTVADDYSKLVFLLCDRRVEFHVAHGRHHSLRVPAFGRDLAFHRQTCEVYVAGASPEIHRFDAEAGRFSTPFVCDASAVNRVLINPEHGLVVAGTQEGRLEAWDPRSGSRSASLDCAAHGAAAGDVGRPYVSALASAGPLKLAAGTSAGRVLLYDARSDRPLTVKDHMNGTPVGDAAFHSSGDVVYSTDGPSLKIWEASTGKTLAGAEAAHDLNGLCPVPGTGLLFAATESPRMLTYYVPALGPAPRWCSFLDSLTDELESARPGEIYDDYKFLTEKELEALGLEHLIGTDLLRAYMHGYFVDARLHRRAKSATDPFTFEEFKKRRIRERLESERAPRLRIHDDLPKVNRDLAERLAENAKNGKAKTGDLLRDRRFQALFSDADFRVDRDSEEYRLINPVATSGRFPDPPRRRPDERFESAEITADPAGDSDADLFDGESSDDGRARQTKRRGDPRPEGIRRAEPKFYALKREHEFGVGLSGARRRLAKISGSSLGDRLRPESEVRRRGNAGNREMTFGPSERRRDGGRIEKNKRHLEDRRRVRRAAGRLGRGGERRRGR